MTSFPHPSTSESGPDTDPNRDDPNRDDPDREEQAHAYCLRLLTARARTRAELAGKLTQRGYAEPVVSRVLDRLAKVGLVDDEDFAEQWVRSRHLYAGKGKRALAAELRRKGVDDEVISSSLADIDAGAERDRAEQLVRDRLRREKLDDEPGSDLKVKRRLTGMLARRGYNQSMALDVVSVELASERERRRV
jgi:regulatory protein